jgi:Tfp pilus assembly protein PilW
MLVNAPSLSDERGTTMIELIVGMAMGMVVLVGLTVMIITVVHGTARVDARVEATDNARVAVAQITEELHSACVSPQIAPVRTGSNGTELIFWHAAAGQASAVAPTPVKSKIVYSGSGTLTQTDYAQVGGTSPNWTFEGEGENHGTGSARKLLTNVAPGNGTAVFTYSRYEGGEAKTINVTTLGVPEAAETVTVSIALTASPRTSPVADKGSTATIKDSATMRLTPPSFETTAGALPCQ